MTKIRFVLIAFVFAACALAQTTHTVTLTWVDALNPTGTTYTVYRANGACSGTPSYVNIASAVTVKTYDDVGINPGRYCYAVTANYNEMESDYSTPATAQVKPFKPTLLILVVI